jgi:GntR family transcriptional regulator
MLFKLTANNGQPLYLQLIEQVRHGIENGTLRHGDQLPGIRTLAQELLVSPATVVKAYAELEHERVLELRQGLGAFICATTRSSNTDRVQQAKKRIRRLLADLREAGLLDNEIRRIFEAELLLASEEVTTL